MLDSGAAGPGFKSQPQRCQVTNSLRQTVHTHRASVHQAAKLVASLLRVAGVTVGLAESNGSLPPGLTHVTCRLTAKNRDQLRNPTLGNRVWATFLVILRQIMSLVIGKFHYTGPTRPDRTRTDPRRLFRETRAADPGLRQSPRTLSGRVRSGPYRGI